MKKNANNCVKASTCKKKEIEKTNIYDLIFKVGENETPS